MPKYTINLEGSDKATISIKDGVVTVEYEVAPNFKVQAPVTTETIDLAHIKKHVMKLYDQYGKIEAIKAVRNLVSEIGLREAKMVVEEWVKMQEEELRQKAQAARNQGYLEAAMEEVKHNAYDTWGVAQNPSLIDRDGFKKWMEAYNEEWQPAKPEPVKVDPFENYDGCECEDCRSQFLNERYIPSSEDYYNK